MNCCTFASCFFGYSRNLVAGLNQNGTSLEKRTLTRQVTTGRVRRCRGTLCAAVKSRKTIRPVLNTGLIEEEGFENPNWSTVTPLAACAASAACSPQTAATATRQLSLLWAPAL